MQAKIIKLLKDAGGKPFPITVTAGMQRGTPDILCCYNGRFLGIEVKEGKDRLSEIQIAQGKQIEWAGGYFVVAACIEDVKEVMEVIDGCR